MCLVCGLAPHLPPQELADETDYGAQLLADVVDTVLESDAADAPQSRMPYGPASLCLSTFVCMCAVCSDVSA